MRIKTRHVIKFSIRFNKITFKEQVTTIQQLNINNYIHKLSTNH
jgi:hypothetical protein